MRFWQWLGLILLVGWTVGTAPRTTWTTEVNPAQGRSSPPDAEQRLRELGIQLPEPSTTLAIYKRIVIVDRVAYLSGHIPVDAAGKVMQGKLGADIDVPTGAAAARQCGLALLSTLRNEVGSLNKVQQLVKTTGMVNATDNFTEHPEVINGCSQLFVDIFGDQQGKGARAAVGMVSLPRNAICEIEMIVQLKE